MIDNVEDLIEKSLAEGMRVNPKYVRLGAGSGANTMELVKELESLARELKMWAKEGAQEVIAHVPDEWIPYWK